MLNQNEPTRVFFLTDRSAVSALLGAGTVAVQLGETSAQHRHSHGLGREFSKWHSGGRRIDWCAAWTETTKKEVQDQMGQETGQCSEGTYMLYYFLVRFLDHDYHIQGVFDGICLILFNGFFCTIM